jgi:hypothetical protein
MIGMAIALGLRWRAIGASVASTVLKEDGAHLLLEDGSYILLE